MLKGIKKNIRRYKKYNYNAAWKKIGGVYAIIDCAVAQLFFGSTPEDYFALEFWRKSTRERAQYLTYRIDRKIFQYVINHVTAEQFWRIGDKLQFNRFFADFMHRDFLNAAEADEDTVRAFIEKHGVILAKKVSLTQGHGILKISKEDIDSELLKKLISESYLLEELVIQHPDLARINESSVNTVRIGTVIDAHSRAHVVGACLRCGMPGNYVDNFHSGGLLFPIDVDYGIVINKGRSASTFVRHVVHPGSGITMVGFKIPNWEMLVDRVIQAAEMVPEMLYLGWDIAVTKDGVEFIEANIGQGNFGVQADHDGKLDMLRKMLPIRL